MSAETPSRRGSRLRPLPLSRHHDRQSLVNLVGTGGKDQPSHHHAGATGRSRARAARRRVLMIIRSLQVPFAGRAWWEARTLARANYEVSIICPKATSADFPYELVEGVHIYRHLLPVKAKWAYPFEQLSVLWLSIRIFFDRGFDAIHACDAPHTAFFIGGLFKLLARTSLVFDYRNANAELGDARCGRLFFERMIFYNADIILAESRSDRHIALERGGAAPSKTFVVRSATDLTRTRVPKPKPEFKCGRAHLIGYVGTVGQDEGIDLLLKAVRVLVRNLRRHDIHFGIVGGGSALADMRLLAEHLGVADYVTFTGRLPDRELLQVLSAADVCVNSNRVKVGTDGSTLDKIMKYMALGKPIVQFDLSESRALAAEASLYARANDPVDMAGKILSLINNPKLRAEMGEIGRTRVIEELSWKNEAPKLLGAYEAVFKSRGMLRLSS
jgi:glycosyltransferase involved in cell wall biosynthesis